MSSLGAGIPYIPSYSGTTGATLKHLVPQIAAESVHVLWEAFNNATRTASTRMVLVDPTLDLSMALVQEKLNRLDAWPQAVPAATDVPQRWGALGDIAFGLLQAPETIDVSEGVIYAQHPVINAKPRLQLTGQGLRELRLGLKWHHLLHSDMEDWLEKLLVAMRTGKVLDLVVGDGPDMANYAGKYVIQRIPYQVGGTRADGTAKSMELTVELIEWIKDPELLILPPAPALKKGRKASPATQSQTRQDPVDGSGHLKS